MKITFKALKYRDCSIIYVEYDCISLPKSLVSLFTVSFSFKEHIVWNSYYSLSMIGVFAVLTGYGGPDSCLHRTKLSQYITPLLKSFY